MLQDPRPPRVGPSQPYLASQPSLCVTRCPSSQERSKWRSCNRKCTVHNRLGPRPPQPALHAHAVEPALHRIPYQSCVAKILSAYIRQEVRAVCPQGCPATHPASRLRLPADHRSPQQSLLPTRRHARSLISWGIDRGGLHCKRQADSFAPCVHHNQRTAAPHCWRTASAASGGWMELLGARGPDEGGVSQTYMNVLHATG